MSKFRLVLKDEKKKPDEAKGESERPEKAGSGGTSAKKDWEEKGIPAKCHAFLEAFNEKPEEKNTFKAENANYAIIGRGFAATVNLATLRSKWGEQRTLCGSRQFRLVHIGHPDPWLKYVGHNMNQELELLTLPGYAARPAHKEVAPAQRWLPSRDFAKINDGELRRAHEIAEKKKVFREPINIPLGVKYIDWDEGTSGFRIHLEDGSSVRARRVDICTGTGAQTYAEATTERGVVMSKDLWLEYLHPNEGSTVGKARVYSAEMYVAGDNQVIATGSVLIAAAASPAGLQAGEHALCEDSNQGPAAGEVVFLASRAINDGFLPIGRLDDLARTADGPLPVRLDGWTGTLFPNRSNVWFAENGRVKSIEVLTEKHREVLWHEGEVAIDEAAVGKKLLVTFAKPSRFVRGAKLPDKLPDSVEGALEYGLFDQVVLNTGRARGENDEGSALQLVKTLVKELDPIDAPGYPFPVGLQAKNGKLRILGAAGINNAAYKTSKKGPEFAKYERSLPYQARVAGEGVTLAAFTVALANRYFEDTDEDRNRCLNTAPIEDLEKLLGAEVARKIYLTRHWRTRPFLTRVEAVRAAEYWDNFLGKSPWDATEPQKPDALVAKALALKLVAEINDPTVLNDDTKWERLKKFLLSEEWAEKLKPTELKWDVIDLTVERLNELDALLRYAHHIPDVEESRAKVRLSGP